VDLPRGRENVLVSPTQRHCRITNGTRTPRNRGAAIPVIRRIQYGQMFATILKVQVRKIRILAVDHNPLLLEGLSLLIQLEPDMDLVGAVASGEEAVDWFRREKPDVTLMDLDLPSGAGVTAIRKILKIDPATCVLGLMTYEEDESGTQALAAGARKCLTKDRLNQDLAPAVRDCARQAG